MSDCVKCREGWVTKKYDPDRDLMIRKCLGFGYTWTERPADYRHTPEIAIPKEGSEKT